MNTIACYKIVYEEQDIAVATDRSLSFDKAELKLGLYDLNAIEEATKLAADTGGIARAISLGGDCLDDSKLRKGLLSRGPAELYLVKDPSLKDADTNTTAKLLSLAAQKIGFDLILCGEGSSDCYAQQVGVQLGEILGLPVINAVSKITPAGDKVVVERTLEDSVEVLEITLPAVLSLTSDINKPRLPGMKDILAAGKKPVKELTLADIGAGTGAPAIETVSVLAPKQAERKRDIVEGETKVAEFLEKFRSELK
ncbi:electron transfer flavoprotein [Deferribacterales bacterium RsTz2092]|nr:electron transfer flavoprotein FixB [Deferribacterales bacterium]